VPKNGLAILLEDGLDSAPAKVLHFFTGNIGFHHVHHLNARIPNYNLTLAHRESPMFRDVPTLSLWDGLRALRLKLWDEDLKRLVTFAQAHKSDCSSRAGPGTSQSKARACAARERRPGDAPRW